MWEIIGYGILGILLVLLVVLLVPIYARVTFDGELRLRVRVCGIPVFRYSSEEQKEPTPSTDKPSRLGAVAERVKRDGVATTLSYVKELSRLAVGTARRLIAAVTVDKLCLQLYITGSDAAQTAENTGKVCAFLYPTVTALQQTVLRIKKREITVTPDFLGEQGRATADITVHVIPLRVLAVAVWSAVCYRMIQKEVSQDGKQSAESDGTVH